MSHWNVYDDVCAMYERSRARKSRCFTYSNVIVVKVHRKRLNMHVLIISIYVSNWMAELIVDRTHDHGNYERKSMPGRIQCESGDVWLKRARDNMHSHICIPYGVERSDRCVSTSTHISFHFHSSMEVAINMPTPYSYSAHMPSTVNWGAAHTHPHIDWTIRE